VLMGSGVLMPRCWMTCLVSAGVLMKRAAVLLMLTFRPLTFW